MSVSDKCSEKSFQSCEDANEGKESEKSFRSCPEDEKKVEEEDDDIRIGSCRENASDDDDVDSWVDEPVSDLENSEIKLDIETGENYDNDIVVNQNDMTINHNDDMAVKHNGDMIEKHNDDMIEKHNDDMIEKHSDDMIEKHNDDVIVKHDEKISNHKKYDKKDPLEYPRVGRFFMHDDREEVKQKAAPQKKEEKKWTHDLFDEVKQNPISDIEIINRYGYNIREEKPENLIVSKEVNNNDNETVIKQWHNKGRRNKSSKWSSKYEHQLEESSYQSRPKYNQKKEQIVSERKYRQGKYQSSYAMYEDYDNDYYDYYDNSYYYPDEGYNWQNKHYPSRNNNNNYRDDYYYEYDNNNYNASYDTKRSGVRPSYSWKSKSQKRGQYEDYDYTKERNNYRDSRKDYNTNKNPFYWEEKSRNTRRRRNNKTPNEQRRNSATEADMCWQYEEDFRPISTREHNNSDNYTELETNNDKKCENDWANEESWEYEEDFRPNNNKLQVHQQELKEPSPYKWEDKTYKNNKPHITNTDKRNRQPPRKYYPQTSDWNTGNQAGDVYEEMPSLTSDQLAQIKNEGKINNDRKPRRDQVFVNRNISNNNRERWDDKKFPARRQNTPKFEHGNVQKPKRYSQIRLESSPSQQHQQKLSQSSPSNNNKQNDVAAECTMDSLNKQLIQNLQIDQQASQILPGQPAQIYDLYASNTYVSSAPQPVPFYQPYFLATGSPHQNYQVFKQQQHERKFQPLEVIDITPVSTDDTTISSSNPSDIPDHTHPAPVLGRT